MLRVKVRVCELAKLIWVYTKVFATLCDPDTFTQVYFIYELFKY